MTEREELRALLREAAEVISGMAEGKRMVMWGDMLDSIDAILSRTELNALVTQSRVPDSNQEAEGSRSSECTQNAAPPKAVIHSALTEYVNRCSHEWYQGRCVHCDVGAKNGRPMDDDRDHWYKQFLIEQSEHQRAILDRDCAIAALQLVRYELAALVEFPDEPNFQPACSNPADVECLMRAYAATDEYKSSHAKNAAPRSRNRTERWVNVK